MSTKSLHDLITHPSLRGGGTIYPRMSALARKHNAVDLAQGFPRTPGPQELIDYAAESLRTGGQHQYTDPRGLAGLRSALAEDALARYARALDPETEVGITAGGQDALGAAMIALLDVGDEVIFIEPFYNPMIPMARRSGATMKFVTLDPTDFHLDEDTLRSALSAKTKLIVYNSPNNPSGKVLSADEVDMLARACDSVDAYLLADEVYEHLVYDDTRHSSALAHPGLKERAVVVSSLSKTFSLTGWRVGWVMGAAPLVSAIVHVHELMSFCLPAFLQDAARFAIADLGTSAIDKIRDGHEARRDTLVESLRSAGLSISSPQGSIFCALDISKITDMDDLEFCESMPITAGVAGIPMSLSWNERRHGRNWVRLCFARSEEELTQAARGLAEYVARGGGQS